MLALLQLFRWRKASNGKKLMNRLQCHLKLLRCKLNGSVKQLREEIDSLLKNGDHHLAYNKIEKLYMGENLKQVYELLDSYGGFVLTNLSYIKRHRECPSDVKEAVSSLIFASERVLELPELKELREFFEDRYGVEFASIAAELLPGNLVNCQLKSNVLMKTVAEEAKNRLFAEMLQDSLEPSAYSKIEPPQLCHGYDRITPMEAVQSSPRILASPEYHKQELVYLDDIEELKLPAREGVDRDQRVFVFKPFQAQEADQPRTRMSKRQRRKKQCPKKDDEFEVYYSRSPTKQRKHQKKAREDEDASLARDICEKGEVVGASFRYWLKKEETETLSRSRNSNSSRRIQIGTFLADEIGMESPVEVSRSALSSPSHVHPKLPDYDELEAMFKALKKQISSRANI